MFTAFREKSVNKKPATSEFLDWMNVLKNFGLLSGPLPGNYNSIADNQKFISSLNTLFKSKEDMERAAGSVLTKSS